MRRAHAMPFGAELSAEGVARFRLWAPAAKRVELELPRETPARTLALQPQPGGWFEASLPDLAPGTLYAYRIDGGAAVPDPASRYNPGDATGPSALVDPLAFDWTDDAWRGRRWHEAIIYELHVGTFTPRGTFRAAIERLDDLVRLGISVVELMPVADFPGQRGWGYDGVLPFAPDSSYGKPEDLKLFVAAAHARGMAVLLDVVYNHFGPEGNFLSQYAPAFFNAAKQTPWGAAINYDAEGSRTVRDFFLHNALYWIEEYHLDGLRVDAVHAIHDASRPHLVAELGEAVALGPGCERQVHLVLENDRNEARWLESGEHAAHPVTAQWNDDFHHAVHVLITGEHEGYYGDYARAPARQLARVLAEGFAYQGERSRHRDGEARGEPSAHLPPARFVNFLQNHDQVGNRALGERLSHMAPFDALHLAVATLLLAPSVPMLFMGEEFAAGSPFLYFCDYRGELAKAVREGRRREFASFAKFRDPATRELIPDPNSVESFTRSRLDWSETTQPAHDAWLARYRFLVGLRQLGLIPHLAGDARGASHSVVGASGIVVDWVLGDGSRLHLRANFSAAVLAGLPGAPGALLYETSSALSPAHLPAWSGVWTIE